MLQQSVLLAFVGYVPSLSISWALYLFIGAKSGMPMIMTWQIAALVLVLAVVMCMAVGHARPAKAVRGRSGGFVLGRRVPRTSCARSRRKTPLAWKNLTHDWRRLAVAVAGIGFAVLLMFTQVGFQNALFDSQVKMIDDLRGRHLSGEPRQVHARRREAVSARADQPGRLVPRRRAARIRCTPS